MGIRWLHLGIAVFCIEALMLLVPSTAMMVLNAQEAAEPRAIAARLGEWIGPIAGLYFCYVGGWWVAKEARRERRLANGVLTGVCAALLDMYVAFALEGAILPIVSLANAARILGATFAGWLAARRA